MLNEVMNLSELAEQCAENVIYEFMFSDAPLHVEMATGGPINPVGIKAAAGSTDGDGTGDDDPEPTETGSETTTDAEVDTETDSAEATAASGDRFEIAAAAAGLVGLVGAAARALRDSSGE